ncbi:MAG: GAF domain-containing protein [Thermoleophilia bacterium]
MGLQKIIDDLRQETNVFRTTLRLEVEDGTFPIAVESLGEGAGSLKGPTPFDLRQTATFKWLEEEQRILVQPDVREGPAPPMQLIELYGTLSQMLAPVMRDGRMIGIISVHHAAEPREWTGQEIEAIERAQRLVETELNQA